MEKYITFAIEEHMTGQTVEKVLRTALGLTKKQISRAKFQPDGIRKNGVQCRTTDIVQTSDQIMICIEAAKNDSNHLVSFCEDAHPLEILYEDEDVIAVNKPKQMVVHPAPGHYSGTLVNALMYHCGNELSGINGTSRPGIVHRIDMDTTGSLIICKNDMAHQSLAAQLKEHSINRIYEAIVHGNIKEEEGTVNAPIGRHPTDRKKMSIHAKNARNAITHYKVLKRFGEYTYIQCKLETGRTHQIRVHMASIGHPLLGDQVYGPKKCPFSKLIGQTLHARTLGFIHPRTGEYIEVNAPLPDYFLNLLEKLS